MRLPNFSSSLLASGTRRRPPCGRASMSGCSPARSTPSRNGTSPDTVESGEAPMSTCPARTSRSTSCPPRLRSACGGDLHLDPSVRLRLQAVAQHDLIDPRELRLGVQRLGHAVMVSFCCASACASLQATRRNGRQHSVTLCHHVFLLVVAKLARSILRTALQFPHQICKIGADASEGRGDDWRVLANWQRDEKNLISMRWRHDPICIVSRPLHAARPLRAVLLRKPKKTIKRDDGGSVGQDRHRCRRNVHGSADLRRTQGHNHQPQDADDARRILRSAS